MRLLSSRRDDDLQDASIAAVAACVRAQLLLRHRHNLFGLRLTMRHPAAVMNDLADASTVRDSATTAPPPRCRCQRFLKRRTVFLHVFVYAERSALRFPGAQRLSHLIHQEGNMAKKAKKAKKAKTAKSAVKKTAKKTKKVAKKKK